MICTACGTENEAGRKFCAECGAALARGCPACGTPNAPTAKFCGECGAELLAFSAAPEPAGAPPPSPQAERRLVSVLFADLVGFTAASESRDAEDTRELLTRYFELARTTIERYGGTVEKFIGDAVMAVWGAPVATEDDAERGVRAALDLIADVPALEPALSARGGVLTGEAAVTVGAEAQGMVAGDLVNTASRIQSAAEPGTVLVGAATKRASEAAIVYAPGGSHELKGKTEPVELFRALRVAAGIGGALKATGLEPPFVGRDRELRLVKDLFHASADEKRAQLVSVIGIPGIGKSRLGWEFFKYMDGLTEQVWWHRGRCLAYGEGVAFWALAEMVRMRARIAEAEEPDSARAKLAALLAEHFPDGSDRDFVEPRLAHLLALEDAPPSGNEDLFGAWRLLFERLAEQGPVAMLFEDLQWADAALVEFVDHLLEWSRNLPIFVLCLARPELQARHPEFGHGSRNQTTLFLDPLSEGAMRELLAGFVPGLPDELRDRVLARAEGVPLYAVETVRMLLDRGLLEERDGAYRPTGPVDELAVPETLHGLIAARLDGLSTDERRLLQNAAVLGKTFTADALAAVGGGQAAPLEPLLAALVRKEVLGVQADPRSPERGQYGFLQDLVRHVAYETLARADRRHRHLAAAAYLEESFAAEQEIVEVVAAHYVAAYEAQPDADDADEVRRQAYELLTRAGDRAQSLGAVGEAQRHLEQAAELAAGTVERAAVLERAAEAAIMGGGFETAAGHLETASELFAAEGETHAAARTVARRAYSMGRTGRSDEAVALLEQAYDTIRDGDELDVDLAEVASMLANEYAFRGDFDRAEEPNERALGIAQALRLPRVLTRALWGKAIALGAAGRPEEQLALMRHALRVSLDHELLTFAGISCGNVSDVSFQWDLYGDALEALDQGLGVARRSGDRPIENFLLAERSYAFAMTGRWTESLAILRDVAPEGDLPPDTLSLVAGAMEVLLQMGHLEEAEALHSRYEHLEAQGAVQERVMMLSSRAALRAAQRRLDEALAAGTASLDLVGTTGVGSQGRKQAFAWAVDAALALGETERADKLIAAVEQLAPGLRPPLLDAHAHRFRGRMRGDEAPFKTAASLFREYDMPFWLAVTRLEHGEFLIGSGRAAEAASLLDETREIFNRLGATPWLERLERTSTGEVVPA
jgi:class 3 adenylate cyclase/tetratricopeptide (TPR) repeat protein